MNEQVKVKEQQPRPVQTPFFVRFLEPQEALAVQTDVRAGRTLKYPSDTDED
jgi:urease beta subunit